MKVKELIDYVNSIDFCSLWDMEDSLCYDFLDKELPKRVVEKLEIEKKKWYEISTSVYKLENGFVGVRGVSTIYSEYMDAVNCVFKCTASEYQEIPSVIYKRK